MFSKKILTALGIMFLLSTNVFAWDPVMHEWLTVDALKYMKSELATPEERRAYKTYLKAAGGSFKRLAQIMGTAAGDVDKFKDTRLGGWWIGYHYGADDLTFGLMDNNYTSFWHFLSIGLGSDIHGNDHGGYNYRLRTNDPSWIDYDWIVMVWLYNQELKWKDYKTTEAHYRQGGYSDWDDQYRDYQDIAWQPIDNLAKYWYQQFKKMPTLQRISYVGHAASDVAVPQHTWNTLANNHLQFENWCTNFYFWEKLADFDAVKKWLAQLNPNDDIETMLTKTAEISYLQPDVLFNKRHRVRLETARDFVPLGIAMIVTVLTKGANYLHNQDKE